MQINWLVSIWGQHWHLMGSQTAFNASLNRTNGFEMDLKYSWESIRKKIFHWNFVYELVHSNNTGDITLSNYVNSHDCTNNVLSVLSILGRFVRHFIKYFGICSICNDIKRKFRKFGAYQNKLFYDKDSWGPQERFYRNYYRDSRVHNIESRVFVFCYRCYFKA